MTMTLSEVQEREDAPRDLVGLLTSIPFHKKKINKIRKKRIKRKKRKKLKRRRK